MENIEIIIHWLSYTYFMYVFGYAAISKVSQHNNMMFKMRYLGITKLWTLTIGIGESLGVTFLLLGLFNASFKTIGILILMLFAIGAFAFHMIRKDYSHYHTALIMCVITAVLLVTTNNAPY
ncbi:DoxX family protein [Myroides odoratus]|uniref:DoxX family protein n=1 Tax=Myroides odoratus TaxID=256 RepID=UPI003341DEAB